MAPPQAVTTGVVAVGERHRVRRRGPGRARPARGRCRPEESASSPAPHAPSSATPAQPSSEPPAVHRRIVSSPRAPQPAGPGDPAPRGPRPRGARGRAAVPPRRHRDRRPPRHDAARRAGARRVGALDARRAVHLPHLRDDGAGRAAARRRGGRSARRQLAAQALWLALAIGLAIAVVCIAARGPADPAHRRERRVAATLAERYLRISALGAPARAHRARRAGLSARHRRPAHAAHHRRRRPTWRTSLLEVLFVYGFDWGLDGSAAGTVIAQVGMGVAFAVLLLRAGGPGVDRRPAPELIKPLVADLRGALPALGVAAHRVPHGERRPRAGSASRRSPRTRSPSALHLHRARARRDRDRRRRCSSGACSGRATSTGAVAAGGA